MRSVDGRSCSAHSGRVLGWDCSRAQGSICVFGMSYHVCHSTCGGGRQPHAIIVSMYSAGQGGLGSLGNCLFCDGVASATFRGRGDITSMRHARLIDETSGMSNSSAHL